MKTKYLLFTVMLLAACSKQNGKSDAYGNFETEPVIVSSEMPGKIISVNFSQGIKIDSGSLLAVVDTVPVLLQINQVKAQIAASGSRKITSAAQVDVYVQQIENLMIDRKRLSEMFREEAATQKQLDDLNGQIKVLEKQAESVKTSFQATDREIDVLESQLAIAENNFKKCFIHAPSGGTILEKYIEQGEITGAGKSIAKIAGLSQIILKVYVSGSQLPSVKLGQKTEIRIDNGKKEFNTFTGVVSWISPEAEFTPKIIQTKEERVKLVYGVKIKVSNDGSMKIGMPGEVIFK